MGARFEIARTCLDLASVIHRENDQDAVAVLRRARALFVEMDVPAHVERADDLTREIGISLG